MPLAVSRSTLQQLSHGLDGVPALVHHYNARAGVTPVHDAIIRRIFSSERLQGLLRTLLRRRGEQPYEPPHALSSWWGGVLGRVATCWERRIGLAIEPLHPGSNSCADRFGELAAAMTACERNWDCGAVVRDQGEQRCGGKNRSRFSLRTVKSFNIANEAATWLRFQRGDAKMRRPEECVSASLLGRVA